MKIYSFGELKKSKSFLDEKKFTNLQKTERVFFVKHQYFGIKSYLTIISNFLHSLNRYLNDEFYILSTKQRSILWEIVFEKS